jgi:cytochrome d ubiquinol oxidase subunit II
VLIGNLLLGLPFHFDQDLRPFYDGSFFELLNPFALLCGIVSLLISSFHGALFLKWRTEGIIHQRTTAVINYLGLAVLIGLIIIMLWYLLRLIAQKLPKCQPLTRRLIL